MSLQVKISCCVDEVDLGASRPASFLELRKRTRSAGRATLCKVTKFTKLVELVK